MSRLLRNISILLALAAATFGDTAAQSRVSIASVGSDVRVTNPGGIGTLLFRAQNDGTDSTTVSVDIELPQGWNVLGRPGVARLGPGGSRNLLVAFRPDMRALPDTNRIRLIALSEAGDTLSSASALVSVPVHHALSAVVLSAPTAAPLQDPYRIRFAVTNEGNVRQSVDLNANSTLGFGMVVAPERLILAPFSSAEVIVDVRPDDDLSGRQTNVVNLIAVAEIASGPGPVARVQARTDVLRRGSSLAAKVPRMPVRLGFSAAGTAGASSRQFDLSIPEVSLAGGRLAMHVRGPSVRSVRPFAAQDRYQLSFTSSRFDLQFGDQYQRQTELMTSGMPGFGVNVATRIGRLETSAFVLRSRFGYAPQSREGLSIALPVHPSFRIGMNAMAEQYTVNSYAASFSSEWAPDRNSAIHFEYGMGRYDAGSGSGFSVGLRRSRNRSRIDLRYAKASDFFPGSFRGSSRLSGSFSFSASRAVTFFTNYGRYRRTYDFALSTPTGNDEARAGVTTSFGLFSSARLQTTLSANTRGQNSSTAGLSRNERFATGSISIGVQNASASFNVEGGQLDVDGAINPFLKSDASFFLRYGRLDLSGQYMYERGARVYFPIDAQRRQMGASLGVKLIRAFETRFEYYTNSTIGKYNSRNDFAQLTTDWTLPFGHVVGLIGRYSRYASQGFQSRDLAGGMTYRVPLDVPVRRSSPGISGRVLMADTGAPVRDAIVSLGDQIVLTDSKGKFAFAATSLYTRLDLETTLVDHTLVVMNPDALLLTADAGPRTDRELYLVQGGAITGRLRLDARRDPLSVASNVSQADLDVSGLAVIATNGSEERHTMTLLDGTFRLTGIAPGDWTVRPATGTLPSAFKVDPDPILVHVTAGSSTEVNIPVGLKTRTVRMIASASLSLAKPGAAKDETTVKPSTEEIDSRVDVPRADKNTPPGIASATDAIAPSNAVASADEVAPLDAGPTPSPTALSAFASTAPSDDSSSKTGAPASTGEPSGTGTTSSSGTSPIRAETSAAGNSDIASSIGAPETQAVAPRAGPGGPILGSSEASSPGVDSPLVRPEDPEPSAGRITLAAVLLILLMVVLLKAIAALPIERRPRRIGRAPASRRDRMRDRAGDREPVGVRAATNNPDGVRPADFEARPPDSDPSPIDSDSKPGPGRPRKRPGPKSVDGDKTLP